MPTTDIELLIAELANLRVRVAQLEAAAATDHRTAQRTQEEDDTLRRVDDPFRPGDRVRITNKVKRPATWDNSNPWNQEAAQRATVTRIYKEQVHFRTDNGIETWRARNNPQLA